VLYTLTTGFIFYCRLAAGDLCTLDFFLLLSTAGMNAFSGMATGAIGLAKLVTLFISISVPPVIRPNCCWNWSSCI